MDEDVRSYRMSDEDLERFLKNAVEEIKFRARGGYYNITLERQLLIELVARELERKNKEERDA